MVFKYIALELCESTLQEVCPYLYVLSLYSVNSLINSKFISL